MTLKVISTLDFIIIILEIRDYYLSRFSCFVRGNRVTLPTGPLWRPEQ